MRRFAALILALTTLCSQAGQFAVSPIRVEISAKSKSDAITVSNNGSSPLRIALELKRWTQDASGKDIYTSTPDELVYFPRQFELAPKKKQVVRIARKTAAGASEVAYRLYFNEQPNISADSSAEGQLSMVVSFGVPIFIAPNNSNVALTQTPARVEAGKLNFTLRNEGNVTQRLTRIQIGTQGAQINQFENWYLQPGISRSYSLPLPEAACLSTAPQKMQLETDRQTINNDITIAAAACKH
jgi:fimbrial chaperone protein